MFGYVTINREELKIKDMRRYQSFYCGICRELKDRHGSLSRITLTYDMTFLAILLTGLYEGEKKEGCGRCLLHPLKKHPYLQNAYTAYAADMNLLLSYYNLLDNWFDERKPLSYTAARALRKEFLAVCKRYPRQHRAVKRYMKLLGRCEQKKQLQSGPGRRTDRRADGRDLCVPAGRLGRDFAQAWFFHGEIHLSDGCLRRS